MAMLIPDDMHKSWASLYGTPCVVVTGMPLDADDLEAIVRFAERCEAVTDVDCEAGEEPHLVIHFHACECSSAHPSGPATYTAQAIRDMVILVPAT